MIVKINDTDRTALVLHTARVGGKEYHTVKTTIDTPEGVQMLVDVIDESQIEVIDIDGTEEDWECLG